MSTGCQSAAPAVSGPVLKGDEILTTIEDMIEAMTDTKIMITGTEEGRPLLTTVATGHDRDPVPIVQDAIDTGVIVPEDFAFSSF